MQLRFQTGLTSEQYVSAEAWRAARLDRCPNHPHGGCSLARHGTYERRTPAGTQIARWYCRESHTTFNLLPDCLAARLPGTLRRLEEVVVHAEQLPYACGQAKVCSARRSCARGSLSPRSRVMNCPQVPSPAFRSPLNRTSDAA